MGSTCRMALCFAVALLACAGLAGVAARRASAGTLPALVAYDDDQNGVWEASVGAGAGARLIAPAAVDPVFSPNGTEIAYLVLHGNSSQYNTPGSVNHIVVAQRAGDQPHTVLTGPVMFNSGAENVFYGLAWSPTGNELAYGCDASQDTDPSDTAVSDLPVQQLCVVNVLTGAHHMVTDPATDPYPLAGPGPRTTLSWTPNGQEIIATVFDPTPCPAGAWPGQKCGVTEVGAIDAHTGSTELLTHTAQAWSPSLSPNGREILFWQEGANPHAAPYGAQVMGVGGTGQRQLLSASTVGAGVYSAAIWAPDGKHFLYTAYSTQNEYDLSPFELPVSGQGAPKLVFGVNTNVYSPTWTGILTTCTVPKLRGSTLTRAKKLLRHAGCLLGKVRGPASHRSSRHVVRQSVKAHRTVPAGTKVNVTVH
jgi:Tol biopolymer transport system component